MDIFRTVAHELVHHSQNENSKLPPDAGTTGSDYENQANAMAGVLMRNYAQDRNFERGLKEDVYDVLAPVDCGPFDGGCVLVAQALQQIHGGKIMVLVDHQDQAQHAAVLSRGQLIDYDGAADPQEFVRKFESNELVNIAGIRPIKSGDLPDAPRDGGLVKQLVQALSKTKLESKYTTKSTGLEMKAHEFISELKIDNDKGLGAVPKNKDVDYFGLRVMMRPSTWLKMALPLTMTEKDREMVNDILQRIDEPGFGAPFLEIDIPDSWAKGDMTQPAKVVGHDGRHRMYAIMQAQGDEPVEVHLLPLGWRRRHFDANPEWVQRLNKNIVSQRGMPLVGPFFKLPTQANQK